MSENEKMLADVAILDRQRIDFAMRLAGELTGGDRHDGAKLPALLKLYELLRTSEVPGLTEDDAWEICEVIKILKRCPKHLNQD